MVVWYFTYMFPSTYSQLSASAMILPLKVAVAWGIFSVLCVLALVLFFRYDFLRVLVSGRKADGTPGSLCYCNPC